MVKTTVEAPVPELVPSLTWPVARYWSLEFSVDFVSIAVDDRLAVSHV